MDIILLWKSSKKDLRSSISRFVLPSYLNNNAFALALYLPEIFLFYLFFSLNVAAWEIGEEKMNFYTGFHDLICFDSVPQVMLI